MKNKIIIGVILVLFVIAHFFTGTNDDMNYNEVKQMNEHISIGTGENLVGHDGSNQAANTPIKQTENGSINENENNEIEYEDNLSEIVNSFIHFYYDWNYYREDEGLHDYVTDSFFRNVQNELETEHGDIILHEGEEEESFYVQDVQILVEGVKLFESSRGRADRFDVIVTFDVLYDVPHHDIFSRDIVLRLEIIRGYYGYLINRKTRLNSDGGF